MTRLGEGFALRCNSWRMRVAATACQLISHIPEHPEWEIRNFAHVCGMFAVVRRRTLTRAWWECGLAANFICAIPPSEVLSCSIIDFLTNCIILYNIWARARNERFSLIFPNKISGVKDPDYKVNTAIQGLYIQYNLLSLVAILYGKFLILINLMLLWMRWFILKNRSLIQFFY